MAKGKLSPSGIKNERKYKRTINESDNSGIEKKYLFSPGGRKGKISEDFIHRDHIKVLFSSVYVPGPSDK